MLVFGFILLGFFMLGLDNLIIAILSFLMARQLLANLSDFATDGVRLTKNRQLINALVFHDQPYGKRERTTAQRFRQLFARQAREQRAQGVAARVLVQPCEQVAVDWVDDSGGVSRQFGWTLETAAGDTVKLSEHVFTFTRSSFLEHETYLFENMGPDILRAAKPVYRYAVEDFQCQLYAVPDGKPASATWPRKHWGSLFGYYWSLEPPARLQQAYRRAKPVLPDRVTDELIGRLAVGANGARDDDRLHALREALPRIVAHLRRIPLFVFNPNLKARNVHVAEDGETFRVLRWHRWVLEPIGAGVSLDRVEHDALEEALQGARERADWPPGIGSHSIMLVAAVWKLEELIGDEQYQSAFRLVPRVLMLLKKAVDENGSETGSGTDQRDSLERANA